MKVKWVGSSGILPLGAEVEILAVDYGGCDVPARAACWVRHQPEGCERFQYRSCDLGDLEIEAADPIMFPMSSGGLGAADLGWKLAPFHLR